MSADRRVLAIAAAAMVGLVLVGVVSAELFTTSACEAIDPEPVADRQAGSDVAAVLATALGDLDDDGRRTVQESVDALTARLGPLTGLADVGGAERLAEVRDAVAAVGGTTTVLDRPLTGVRATASVGDGTVVGSGPTLYTLALENPLTGQVDALTPLDTDLEAGSCLDTATVGTPFAFLLDADAGELLLFRVDDDADDPEVEKRDVAGSRWTVDLAVGTAPPGTLAERLSGRLGDDLAVVARRAVSGDDTPAVAAFERDDGTPRWTVAIGELVSQAPDGDGPVRPEVVAVAGGVVVLAVTRDGDGADDREGEATIVGLDADTGRVEWTADLPGPRLPLAVAPARDGTALLAVREDDGVTGYEVDLATGAAQPRTAVAGERAVAAAIDGGFVLAVDEELRVVTGESIDAVTTGATVADLLATDAGVVVLLRTDVGAVAVGFGG